ncbi:MAG TPA: hypothetical protein VF488_11930 [Gemmatimonadaceae bacterium]
MAHTIRLFLLAGADTFVAAALFLASESASWITGIVVDVAGGAVPVQAWPARRAGVRLAGRDRPGVRIVQPLSERRCAAPCPPRQRAALDSTRDRSRAERDASAPCVRFTSAGGVRTWP